MCQGGMPEPCVHGVPLSWVDMSDITTGPGRGWEVRPLMTETYRQACCVPVVRIPGAKISFQFGAYNASGEPIHSVALQRHYGRSSRARPMPARRHETGEFIYGGLLRRHYGHFLLESLARVEAIRRRPGMRVVWHNEAPDGLCEWQQAIFSLLGIDTSGFVYVSEPTTFERLLIPEAGYIVQDWFHPSLVRALACHAFSNEADGPRLWLSRSRLDDRKSCVEGERALEERLAATGWRVLHPQDLTVAGQLAELSRASAIAGFAGSAFHTLVLGENVRAQVLILPREVEVNRNYLTIARAKGLRQVVLPVDLRAQRGKDGTVVSSLVHPERAWQMLEDASTAQVALTC